MMPDLGVLLGPLGWIVHPLAGFSLFLWASVIFSRQGRSPAHLGRAAALIVLLAALGASWVVHPAAGMLLGYFSSRAFDRRWPTYWPALLLALLAGLVFMGLGAFWLIIPLLVMGVIWLASSLRFAGQPPAPDALPASPARPALPEQAGGWPLASFGADAQPVPAAQAQLRPQSTLPQSTAAGAPTDPFTALQLDARLPGEVRAQLVALDLRTREALDHLHAQGQQGSEPDYLARAIREEYAPASVQAYLQLPRTRADVAPIEGGRTGRDLLVEQLDLLLSAVQDILDGTLQSGGQALLTQQRFLEDRFRKVKPDLDV